MAKTRVSLSFVLLFLLILVPSTPALPIHLDIEQYDSILTNLKERMALHDHREPLNQAAILLHTYLQEQNTNQVDTTIIHPSYHPQTKVPVSLLHTFPISWSLTLPETHNSNLFLNHLLAIDPLSPTPITRGMTLMIHTLEFKVLHPIQNHTTNTPYIILKLQPNHHPKPLPIETEEEILEVSIKEDTIFPETTDDFININTASFEELQNITGVGPAYAERIIEYRETHGPFQTIEEIMNVSGIGEARFETMRSEITVDD